MTRMVLTEALRLIDEWVGGLAAEDLPEECRKSGNDFFSFLKAKGFNPGIFVNTVFRVTGHRPNNLWLSEDAELLRKSIFGYHSVEQELSREEYRNDRTNNQWLSDSTQHFFSDFE